MFDLQLDTNGIDDSDSFGVLLLIIAVVDSSFKLIMYVYGRFNSDITQFNPIGRGYSHLKSNESIDFQWTARQDNGWITNDNSCCMCVCRINTMSFFLSFCWPIVVQWMHSNTFGLGRYLALFSIIIQTTRWWYDRPHQFINIIGLAACLLGIDGCQSSATCSSPHISSSSNIEMLHRTNTHTNL